MNKQVDQFVQEQLNEWPLAGKNFAALAGIQTKEVKVNGVNYRVQFNPARIVSSGAKVDKKSIQERKCFLCSENRPAEQRGIPYKQYTVLLNPFPIFPKHLTIPDTSHVDQLIDNRVEDMLALAEQLDEYVLFYNGPKCGASAPDHMHFQAGNKGFLPLETEIHTFERTTITQEGTAKLALLEDEPRNGLLIQGEQIKDLVTLFEKVYQLLPVQEGEAEPMLNLLAWKEENQWYLLLLLRKKHRPSCYFAEGEDKLLSSPASVDLGGVFITPIASDFERMDSNKIQEIVKEVSLSKQEILTLLKPIQDESTPS